ncbi:MAG: FHA domain-containing protein [Pseudomonadota bacterium]
MITLRVFETAESFFEKTYSPDTVVHVGRSETCDLVLRSKRISRNHCKLSFSGGRWTVQDDGSQNGFRLNGTRTDTGVLSNGDRLEIGDFRLEIILPQEEATREQPASQDLDRTVLLEPEADLDKTVLSGVPPAFSQPSLPPLQPVKKGFLASTRGRIIAAAAGVFVLMLLIIIVNGMTSKNKPEPEKAVVAEEAKKAESMMDMETRHRIGSYTQSGTDQYNAGNYNEALVRFQSVLALDPGNATAQDYIANIRQRLMELEQQRQAKAREEQEKAARVNEILSSVRQAVSSTELERAESMISEAVFLAPDNASVLALKKEISDALDQKRKTREAEKKKMSARFDELKQHFDAGQNYYAAENYSKALEEWEQVLAMNIESPEAAHVRSAIPHVKAAMETSVQGDYAKGVAQFQKKDYPSAAELFEKIEKVYPGYKDTQTLLKQAVDEMEGLARQIYQEGLVYEGIGQRQKAEEKWRQVMKAIPVESNTYYQRAKNKLQ